MRIKSKPGNGTTVKAVLSMMRPSAFEGIDAWEKTAEENVKRLLAGLPQYGRK